MLQLFSGVWLAKMIVLQQGADVETLRQTIDELKQKMQGLVSENDEKNSEIESLGMMLESTRETLSAEKVLFMYVLCFAYVKLDFIGAYWGSRASK